MLLIENLICQPYAHFSFFAFLFLLVGNGKLKKMPKNYKWHQKEKGIRAFIPHQAEEITKIPHPWIFCITGFTHGDYLSPDNIFLFYNYIVTAIDWHMVFNFLCYCFSIILLLKHVWVHFKRLLILARHWGGFLGVIIQR